MLSKFDVQFIVDHDLLTGDPTKAAHGVHDIAMYLSELDFSVDVVENSNIIILQKAQ